MRVNEALELAGQEIGSFKATLKDLSIKELHELAKDLRFVNRPEVFKICHEVLLEKLRYYFRAVQGVKAVNHEGLENLRDVIYEKTGFYIDSETSPTTGLKRFIDEIASWAE